MRAYIFVLIYWAILQMSDEQVQVRRLRYVEVEHELLVFDIIQRMEEHVSKPLVTEDGAPNEDAIKGFSCYFLPSLSSMFFLKFKDFYRVFGTYDRSHRTGPKLVVPQLVRIREMGQD